MSIDIDTVATFTRQRTGRHLLDSGDIYGRVYDSPVPTGRFIVGTDGTVSISVTHLLANEATVVPEAQEAIERALAEDDRLGWFESGPHAMEELGYVQAARDNTCNADNDFDQNFVWEVYQRPERKGKDWVYDREAVVLVYAHTGCDVRGGYARPLAVRFESSEWAMPVVWKVSLTPTDDPDDDTYRENQYGCTNDYPTFVSYDPEGEVVTLANDEGERSFAIDYWV